MNDLPETDLFAQNRFAWVAHGTLARYATANTSNHYRWASTHIRKRLAALLGWVGGPVVIKIAIVFLASLASSFALSRWVLARHLRGFAAVTLTLFVFCLVVRP